MVTWPPRTYLYFKLIVRERCRKIIGFVIKLNSAFLLLLLFQFFTGKSILLGKVVARLEPSSFKAFQGNRNHQAWDDYELLKEKYPLPVASHQDSRNPTAIFIEQVYKLEDFHPTPSHPTPSSIQAALEIRIFKHTITLK